MSASATGYNAGNDTYSLNSSANNTVKKSNRKKRPQVQKTPSYNFNSNNSKYVYSVDDDPQELELDLEREYMEGFNDALRYRYKKSSKNLKDAGREDLQSLTQEIANNLINADAGLSKLEQREADIIHNHHTPPVEQQAQDDQSQQGQPAEENTDAGEDGEEQGEEENANRDNVSISSQESFTLRERQDAINETHPFGIRIWKPAIYKKTRSVDREADKDIHETGVFKKKITWEVVITNCMWSLTFGILFFILCLFGSAILVLAGSTPYSKVLFNLGKYLLWPFGKIVYLQKDENYLSEDRNEGTTIREYERWRDEDHNKLFFSASYSQAPQGSASQSREPPLDSMVAVTSPRHSTSVSDSTDDDQQDRKLRFFGRGDWSVGRIVFYMYFYVILQPIFAIVAIFCWLLVLTIPMAKVVQTLADHLRRHPLAVFYKFDSTLLPSDRTSDSNILVCTYRSSGLHYYKYTVEGTNIFFINLMAVVVMTILDFYICKEYLGFVNFFTDESVIFALCLLSIIPLAYFIGQAVASISAQSSMGVGAAINAFFSTIVEIFLYCVALSQGKGLLVEGSLVGSILAAVLLLPGLSMCAGAFIRKTQRYNPASAGVSCTMLLFSLCVMFAPTVFHQIYGTYEINCVPCSDTISGFSKSCQSCHFLQPPLQIDHLFSTVLKPFSIVCAILLFLAYTIGLWFTLRTHAALIWSTPISDPKPKLSASQTLENIHQAQDAQEEPQGHDAPNWSKSKSTIVLLGATLLYAIIAEILVDCVDSVLQDFPIDPKFLGITIFALVPNTTEFLNAISFATHGNVALSMEIGSAYALQVCLIQIPCLVLYSLFFINPSDSNNWNIRESMFTLIFPNWDVIACVVSVVLFTFIYAEGKSNYFKGSILVLVYVIVMIGFYFTGIISADGLNIGITFTITS
jgi:Ca2+:H+ antiporter